MAKLPYIELPNGLRIPILHEDRNVIAIDKPQGWMLAPISWQNTARNLFAALTSSVKAGDFWAKSRNLKFIRFVHRLDADTSGVLLLVKAPGAMPAFTELFEDRKVEKVYLAVVKGVPEIVEWKCRLRLAPMQDRPGRMEINNAVGKDTETLFRVIDKDADRALLMCWPLTGRTHQIRLHLAAVGHPVWADELYGDVPTTNEEKTELKLALRAVRLSYKDPFMAEQVNVEADAEKFVKLHGFDPSNAALKNWTPPEKALEHPKARLEEKRRVEKEVRQEQRAQRREDRPHHDEREDRVRRDWQEEEDSGGFATEGGQEAGERTSRERPQRPFGHGPRGDSRGGDRRTFGGPRKFERREGGPDRRPPGQFRSGQEQRSFGDRPPQRPGFGKKPFGGPGESSGRGRDYGDRGSRGFAGRGEGAPRGERGGGFRGRAGDKPQFGRRGEGRSFGGGRGFDRDRQGDDRGNRAGANELRPGVFPSSTKPGLKAGFQKSGGFGAGSGRRPFRSSTGERSFHGGGGRPFKPRRSDGPREGGRPPGKFGGKPAWGKKPGGRSFHRPPRSR